MNRISGIKFTSKKFHVTIIWMTDVIRWLTDDEYFFYGCYVSRAQTQHLWLRWYNPLPVEPSAIDDESWM